jgi:hypothetical protein
MPNLVGPGLMDGDLVNRVRLHVMERAVEGATIPWIAETAQALGREVPEIRAAYRSLADAHIFVLEPGGDEILMANPFSAVPTAFRVEVGSLRWFGNCVWDSLGILALVGQNGRVLTKCPDCNFSLELEVRDGEVSGSDPVAHFAVPAAKWWDDIVFT